MEAGPIQALEILVGLNPGLGEYPIDKPPFARVRTLPRLLQESAMQLNVRATPFTCTAVYWGSMPYNRQVRGLVHQHSLHFSQASKVAHRDRPYNPGDPEWGLLQRLPRRE